MKKTKSFPIHKKNSSRRAFIDSLSSFRLLACFGGVFTGILGMNKIDLEWIDLELDKNRDGIFYMQLNLNIYREVKEKNNSKYVKLRTC